MPTPTGGLAVPSAQVEVVIGWVALPSHHVEYGRLAPVKPASVFDDPRPEHIDSKSLHPIDCLIYKLPLVLKSASSVGNLKGSDSHDEIVNKLNGDGQKASLHIVVPPLIDDIVFFRRLNIIRVEDDLAVVHIGNLNIPPEGDVPTIVRIVDHFWIYMELQRFSKGSSYP